MRSFTINGFTGSTEDLRDILKTGRHLKAFSTGTRFKPHDLFSVLKKFPNLSDVQFLNSGYKRSVRMLRLVSDEGAFRKASKFSVEDWQSVRVQSTCHLQCASKKPTETV